MDGGSAEDPLRSLLFGCRLAGFLSRPRMKCCSSLATGRTGLGLSWIFSQYLAHGALCLFMSHQINPTRLSLHDSPLHHYTYTVAFAKSMVLRLIRVSSVPRAT